MLILYQTVGASSVAHAWQDNKKEKRSEKAEPKEKPDQQEPVKPDIREVPKARKQSRPPVVKPNVKAKPIKVVRPNIKRP
ncbi:hypothetical protein [Pedobacter africanus]|uniref:Uncharacterized protein n=1 Tax=Pedobacter africanus TaxID=151894 RepID=A0A1W2DBF1_9SPHI|nr:hypothetical protein [Pedobacter africanus]SMC94482.1 hypothetical protein SAMN04488524_3545 [Pedobacter africanus]